MDKIRKLLKLLTPKEREAMLLVMKQLKTDYRKIPGLQAMQGKRNMFRVRLGNYRIIFAVDSKTKSVEILRITRRNEKTYKNV